MLKNTQHEKEKVIVVGIRTVAISPRHAEINNKEMEKLIETAGGKVVHEEIVPLREPSPSTYIRQGKVEEIRAAIEQHGADLVVVDAPLSGSQIRNLEEGLGTRVIDRTELILDIFALHATTPTGKLQVELAQLTHRKTKLRVHAGVLSSLGGGIGTRGPGETKLEIDRRRIDDRISFLKKKLKKFHQRKDLQRKERLDPKIQHVAIVGYTNVGKSTLLNVLTDAGVLVADKLFATLDTTTRKLVLPCGRHVVLTDTVGFIRRLPHEIVEAFQSTFQEAREADLVLHLVDASAQDSLSELSIGNSILEEMNVVDVPRLYVLTKKDLCPNKIGILGKAPAPHIAVSSVTGEGLPELLEGISVMLEKDFEDVLLRFPPGTAHMIYQVRKHGHILSEGAQEDTLEIEARIPQWLLGTMKRFVVEDEHHYIKNF